MRLGRGRRACDPPDDRARCARHRAGGGDRPRADRLARPQHEAVRPPRDTPWRLERAHQRPTDRGQPALGGGSGHGALRGDRRAVGGRRGHRRGPPSGSRRHRLRGHHRPRPARRVRAGGVARPGGPPAADPDPLQHRAAGVRPVRDRARRGPGRPPRRPRDRGLGRRDAPVPAGLAAHRVGAPAGRRAAHGDPGRRRRDP